jgi:hypothetical protein
MAQNIDEVQTFILVVSDSIISFRLSLSATCHHIPFFLPHTTSHWLHPIPTPLITLVTINSEYPFVHIHCNWPLKLEPTESSETSSLANLSHTVGKPKNQDTRWFKYDRDKLWLVYTQIVPVIFEPPCISHLVETVRWDRNLDSSYTIG